MNEISGCFEAVLRRLRKVFSAKGQPQWRRKVMIVGLREDGRRGSLVVEGVWLPIEGGGEVGRGLGEVQDECSWRNVIVRESDVRVLVGVERDLGLQRS